MGRRFPKKERPVVRKLYEEGCTITNLANSYSVHPQTIRKAIKAAGGLVQDGRLPKKPPGSHFEEGLDVHENTDTIHDEFQGKIWY